MGWRITRSGYYIIQNRYKRLRINCAYVPGIRYCDANESVDDVP